MYSLDIDPAAEAVLDALPQHLSGPLTEALADACDDPLGATQPYNQIEDNVMRIVHTHDLRAVLLLGHEGKTITLLDIIPLG